MQARKEAAHYLRQNGFPISWKTLQKMATTGGGPPYRIFGNKALYEETELIEWARARLSAPRHSTSETA
jgi:hypothetical protein